MSRPKITLNTIGSDPEVFVFDMNARKIVPCVGKFPGRKNQGTFLQENEKQLLSQEV